MAQELFIKWAEKYLPGITVKVVQKLNDEKRVQPYRFISMLKPLFSVTGMWNTVGINGRTVMADVVALDSSLPLKSRASTSRASGKIAKMGMEFSLNEEQLTELDTMVATGAPNSQIVNALFSDAANAVSGIYERLEYMLLEGLSTGVTLTRDADNTGTDGVRLDYQVPANHKRGVSKVWTDSTATPIDDIQALVDAADANGDSFVHCMADRYAVSKLMNNAQIKGLFAFNAGFNPVSGTATPNLSETQIIALFQDKWGITLEIVNRTFKAQKNSTITNKKPWQEGIMTFLTDREVGNLVYATLAEENHKDQSVTYTKPNAFILVSNGVDSKPSLRQYTKSQARVAPAVDGEILYILDTKTVQA